MTREEAIEVINTYDFSDDNEDAEFKEALSMAIKALSQEPCDKCVYSTKDGGCQYDDITEAIPPLEPCEDAVSREAVYRLVDDIIDNLCENSIDLGALESWGREQVMELPSVTVPDCQKCETANPCIYCEHEFKEQQTDDDPYQTDMDEAWEQAKRAERQTGEWERHYIRPNVYKDLRWYCSACGNGCGYNNAFMFDFCPNCGADMRGAE